MVLPARPTDAPLGVDFFSGGGRLTDGRLRDYLNGLEGQVDALLGGTVSLVVDDVNGDDSSPDGSAANPLATIVEAERRAALFPDFEIDILVKPGGISGYAWPTFRLRLPLGGKSIWVRFTEFVELIASSEAQGGTGLSVIVTSGGLTPGDLDGKTIEVLSGAAAGDRRTILRNTATNLEPVADFSAAVVATDLFRVIEPDPGNVIVPVDNVPMVIGSGVSESSPFQDGDFVPGLRIVNAIINAPIDLSFCADARIQLFGCEVDHSGGFMRCHGSGQMLFGRSSWSAVGPPAAEATLVDTSWVGWGAFWSDDFPVWDGSVGYVAGYVVAGRWVAFTGEHELTGHMTSGAILCQGEGDPHDTKAPRLTFGALIPLLTPRRAPARVNNTASSPAIDAQNDATIIIGEGTIIDSVGACVRARDARVRIIASVTLNTGTVGLVADLMGEVVTRSVGTITIGTLSGNEVEVGNTPATATIASLSAAGSFLKDSIADDNSIVHTL